MRYIRFAILALLLSACQAGPTKSYDSQAIKQKNLNGGSTAALGIPEIDEQTVVVDARPPFDFALSHLNGAVNLRWEEFAQRAKPFLGLVELDHFALARRLASYGISPDTKVVIVGRGALGEGEEGRLAWTFKYLGVKDVRSVNVEAFSLPRTKEEAPPRKKEPLWKPELDESLIVDRNQFANRVLTPHSSGAENSKQVVVIDVRSEKEFLGRDLKSPYAKRAPDFGAINIPWVQFFTAKGLVNEGISHQLQAVGVTKDRPIYVIDNMGVRSAAVTIALREMGFTHAANFSGGYMELLDRK